MALPPQGGNFPPLVNGPVFKVHAAKLGKKLCISLFVRALSYSAGPNQESKRSEKMKRLPIGISDFKALIENDYLFADTTSLIGEIYREPSKILLITRPRRFGRALNMSMASLFSIMKSAGNDENFFFKVSIDEAVFQINSTGPKPL